MSKIGILSGTFDPVHIGHVESALVARGALGLEKVIFMIEKSPHQKVGVANHSDRFTMLELATKEFPTLVPVKMRADNITTNVTLTFLKKHYKDYKPVLIIGSDMLSKIEKWQDFDVLIGSMEIAVVLRNLKEEAAVEKKAASIRDQYKECIIHILPPVWSDASSSIVKHDIKKNKTSDLIHKDVLHYIMQNNLYS